MMDDMDDSFQNYCMVCDCLIVAAPAPVKEVAVKKRPTGAIRIKNPDGTTTTRTANGVKTTKPTRLVGGAALLAAAAAKAKGLPAPELQPSPRPPLKSRSSSKIDLASQISLPPSPPPPPAFESTIYCSVSCMAKDAGAPTEELKRVFISETNSSSTTPTTIPPSSSPLAPPSPLLTNSDTDSSASASLAAVILRATQTPDIAGSAPRTSEAHNPDGWRDVDRRRRSSAGLRPLEPVVPTRKGSGPGSASGGGASSDSLSSLWNSDYDSAGHSGFQRGVPSRNGSLQAMTPMAPTRRSMSNSDGTPAPIRPLARSALSHSSLGMLASPPSSSHHVGSAPSHAAYLMHSYVSAFPLRDGGLCGSTTPVHDVRSTSVSIVPIPGRPGKTRTRQNSRGGTTWDSFAKSELAERSRRNTGNSDDLAASLPRDQSSPDLRGRAGSVSESTPTFQNGGWHIRYSRDSCPPSTPQTRSRSRSRSREPSGRTSSPFTGVSIPLPIPERGLGPQSFDMVRKDSLPRPGFDWEGRTVHRTYELPKGVVANPNKGLFYFNA